MKKLLKSVSLLLIAVMLMLCLPSCGDRQVKRLLKMSEEERTTALIELSDEVMETLDSYTAVMSMSVSGVYNDVKIIASSNGQIKYAGLNSDSLSHLVSTVTKVNMKGEGIDESESTTYIGGFYDGKMHSSYKLEDSEQKLWSSISAADYAKHLEEQGDDVTLEENECANKSAKQNEDRTWTVTVSGITGESLESMKGLLDDMDALFGGTHELSDVELTITLDAEYIPTKVSFDFKYTEVDSAVTVAAPEIFVEMELKDIDETVVEAPDLSKHTEAYDLTFLSDVKEAYDELTSFDEDVSFVAVARQRVSKMTNGYFGGSSESSYKYTGRTFKDNSGDFKYTLRAHSSEYASPAAKNITLYSYENGKLSIGLDDGTVQQVNDCTEHEAKQFMSSYIDCASFYEGNVIGVMKMSESLYEIKMRESIADDLVSSLKESGAAVNSTEIVLSLKMTDGKITEYTYTIDIEYKLEKQTYVLMQQMEVEFK